MNTFRAGQIGCDQRVEQSSCQTALHDELAELRARGERLVVVQRVVVSGNFRILRRAPP